MCVYMYFLLVKHLVSRLRQGVCVCVSRLRQGVCVCVCALCHQGVCVLSVSLAPCEPTSSGSVCALCQLSSLLADFVRECVCVCSTLVTRLLKEVCVCAIKFLVK